MNMSSAGFEINPSAYLMSAFYECCNLPLELREVLIDNIAFKLEGYLAKDGHNPIYLKSDNHRNSYQHFLKFIQDILPDFIEQFDRMVLLNIFFQSEKDKKLTIKESIDKSFKYIRRCLIELPFTKCSITAHLMDARSADTLFENEVDLVLTSPPYINVFNYHQNHRAIIESLNYDVLKVASSEFGSNRKYRGNRLKTVVQYTVDMEASIRGFWNSLKINGTLIMVLGRESNVRGVAFFNGQLIIDLIKSCGGFSEVRVLERKFMNKFGTNIKEDIIIATKTENELTSERYGREIAIAQLKNGLDVVDELVKIDLLDAIASADTIKESPILDPKQIIR
jgi:hypothetical protein